MKLKQPPQRVTPIHFRERAREYRLAAALADARRDAAMFDDLAMMFERPAGILGEQACADVVSARTHRRFELILSSESPQGSHR
jgi:hypothetical protein